MVCLCFCPNYNFASSARFGNSQVVSCVVSRGDRIPMASLQGQFLVASPHLSDPNFYKSVVLMVKHDEEGAFGLILNRPTTNTVREIWRAVTEQDLECEQPIYMGGPVSGPLVCLHRMKSC